MTKHATSKLLLTAALAIPVFARAQVIGTPAEGVSCGAVSGKMTAEAAKAAIGAAEDKAEDNARRLTQLPVEFAGAAVGVPYGAEGAAICVKEKNLAGYMESLRHKADYWQAVRDALVAERARRRSEEHGSVEKIVAQAKESVQLEREIRGTEALVADADQDIATIKKVWAAAHDREMDSDILARKAKIFSELQSLKIAR